jgi:two-component system cell cycle response regulator
MMPRVLVIEDNDINRELMTYALESFGCATEVAADGAAGIEAARRVRPDLILCDVQMPGLDGFDVVRCLKDDPALRDVPVIAVTALAMVGDRERMLAGGFDGYLSKPIEPQQLASAIGTWLPSALRPWVATVRREAGAVPPVHAVTILIVDDVPLNLEFKRDLLEPHGYTVLTADTMSSALKLARARRPDLIVSDVGLGADAGFDLIRRVKADPALRDIPFMFVTATHDDARSKARALELGAARYLQRPIEPAALLVEIRACLAASPEARPPG